MALIIVSQHFERSSGETLGSAFTRALLTAIPRQVMLNIATIFRMYLLARLQHCHTLLLSTVFNRIDTEFRSVHKSIDAVYLQSRVGLT